MLGERGGHVVQSPPRAREVRGSNLGSAKSFFGQFEISGFSGLRNFRNIAITQPSQSFGFSTKVIGQTLKSTRLFILGKVGSHVVKEEKGVRKNNANHFAVKKYNVY